MFDFIFRRRPRAAVPIAPTPIAAPVPEPKQVALTRAAALDGDESAAVAFILECDCADARALAAQHIQSPSMLEQVLREMHKTDRRVARLMRQRLDAIARQQRTAQQTEACLEAARQLLQEPQLRPNQAAALERDWQSIAAPTEAQLAQYQPLRAALEARLLAQTALQRSALDTLAHLRQLQQTIAAADPLPPAAEITRALAILEGAMANHLAAPEAATLPPHLQAEFTRQRTDFRAAWQQAQQRDQALAERRQALAAWQAAVPATLNRADLQSAWRAGLPLPDGAAGAALEQQFQALLANLEIARRAEQGARRESGAQARQRAEDTLLALENALQQGALQQAVESDNALRALDAVPPAAAARLGAARAELARLQGWARWGGNVSRAELLKAAQELPDQALQPAELARQVGALRSRWKTLDTSAGAAARELWQQFDAACSLAYAPAAEHFKQQAEQRREHQVQAEALLAQVRDYAAALEGAVEPPAIDWKEAAAFCARMQQAWRRLGNLERKEKRRLDRDWEAALQALRQPLAQQQAASAELREQLIAAVLELQPAERGTPDALRALQQRWQDSAKALPLEHKDEEALWQRFRSACDQLFAQRKQVAASADGQRRDNLRAKQALCQTLEAALGESDAGLRRTVADSGAAWAQIGAVPRGQEAQLEQRYRAARTALHKKLDEAERAALHAGVDALHAKLALCQALERQLIDAAPAADDGAARWAALPPLAADFEQALGRRFAAARAAWQSADRAYARELEHNRTRLLNEILHLEIVSGVDSPPALARERLQLQVEVLAAKLKHGDGTLAAQAQWLALCGLSALTDAASAARIERLLQRCRAMPLAGMLAHDRQERAGDQLALCGEPFKPPG